MSEARSLVRKLCEVMDAVSYIQKQGQNSKQNYKYAREADVVSAMRAEFAKRKIFIFPNVIKNTRTKIERLDFDKSLKFAWATDLDVEWTFEDGESGEIRKCIIPGCSESPGDKGVYVAMTGSEKYLLMKSFLLPTGDDPESDENEERGSKQAAKAVGEQKVADYNAKKVNGNGHAAPQAVIPKDDKETMALLQASIEMNEKKAKINFPPVPAPEPPKPRVDARGADVDDVVGYIEAIKDMKTKQGRPYKVITVRDLFDATLELSAFDNFKLSDGELFQYLVKGAVGQEATFTYVSKAAPGGKVYHNVINVSQIGSHRWNDGIGVLEASR